MRVQAASVPTIVPQQTTHAADAPVAHESDRVQKLDATFGGKQSQREPQMDPDMALYLHNNNQAEKQKQWNYQSSRMPSPP